MIKKVALTGLGMICAGNLLFSGLAAAANNVLSHNENYGFSACNKTINKPVMQLVGKDFYGIATETASKATDYNVVFAFPAEEVEKATGNKFSTADFMKNYKKLQVMERCGISPGKVEYSVFDPATFSYNPDKPDGKILDLTGKKPMVKLPCKARILKKTLLDNARISISTETIGKKDYVLLRIVDQGDFDFYAKELRPAMDLQMALTSENDMLYIILSSIDLPNTKKQAEICREATVFKREKIKNRLEAENRAELTAALKDRSTFLKKLEIFAPVENEEEYGFTDKYLAKKFILPDDWAYVRIDSDINADTKKWAKEDGISFMTTLAVPYRSIIEAQINRQIAPVILKEAAEKAREKYQNKAEKKEIQEKNGMQQNSEKNEIHAKNAKQQNSEKDKFNAKNERNQNNQKNELANYKIVSQTIEENIDFKKNAAKKPDIWTKFRSLVKNSDTSSAVGELIVSDARVKTDESSDEIKSSAKEAANVSDAEKLKEAEPDFLSSNYFTTGTKTNDMLKKNLLPFIGCDVDDAFELDQVIDKYSKGVSQMILVHTEKHHKKGGEHLFSFALKNPKEYELTVSKFIGNKLSSKEVQEVVDFNAYSASLNFTDKIGRIDFVGNGSVVDTFPFGCSFRVLFTDDQITLAAYLTKNMSEPNLKLAEEVTSIELRK